MTRRFAFPLLLLLLVAGLACARITQANYDKIEDGMAYDEVVALLGQPTTSKSLGIGPLSGTNARWEGRDLVISVQFVNGRVKLKELSSARGDGG